MKCEQAPIAQKSTGWIKFYIKHYLVYFQSVKIDRYYHYDANKIVIIILCWALDIYDISYIYWTIIYWIMLISFTRLIAMLILYLLTICTLICKWLHFHSKGGVVTDRWCNWFDPITESGGLVIWHINDLIQHRVLSQYLNVNYFLFIKKVI